MKRYRPDDFWFKLDSRMGPTGKFVRFYVVHCCRCGKEGAFHANALGPDGLKKFFQAKHWEIGKTQNHHRCPQCSTHPPKQEESNVIFLGAAPSTPPVSHCERCMELLREKEGLLREREELLREYEATLQEREELLQERAELLRAALPSVAEPVEIEVPAFLEPPKVEPIEEEPEEEPQDWWKELMEKP